MVMARREFQIQDAYGRAISGATVTVRRETSGQPIEPLFSDRAGATPLSNPLTSDSEGKVAWHSRAGAFMVTATKAGMTPQEFRFVPLGLAGESDVIPISAGAKWLYKSSTSMADPSTGNFRLNHATPASATAIAIAATSADLAAMGAAILRWDNSTSSVRGILRLAKSDDPSVWAEFELTGTITDNTTWLQATLQQGAASGSFTADDEFVVTFARTGDTGAVAAASYIDFTEIASPSAPAAGVQRIYAKADGSLYQKNPAGTETPFGGGSGVSPSTDNAAPRFNGVVGALQDSALIIGDAVGGKAPLSAVQSVNGGALAGFRNYLMNGCMRIWQRRATSVADDVYGFDGWIVLTQSNPITLSQQTNLADGTPFAMRLLQANASAQRMGAIQFLLSADSIDLRGKRVILSGKARMSASTTLRYAILEWTSTADAPTSDVVLSWTSGTFTAGNFFLASNLTVTAVGSIALTANTLADITELAGTLGSSGNNVAVMFWTDSTQAQNVTLDLAQIQLEIADSLSGATPFERRPKSVEQKLCYAHYEKSYDETVAPGTSTQVGCAAQRSPGANVSWSAIFKQRKWKIPTVVIYSTTGAAGFMRNPAGSDLAAVASFPGEGNFIIDNNAASTDGVLYLAQWTAAAEL